MKLINLLWISVLSFPVYAELTVKVQSPTLGVVENQPFWTDINFDEEVLGFNLTGIQAINGKTIVLIPATKNNYRLQVMPLAAGPMSIKVLPNVVVSKATNETNRSSNLLEMQALSTELKPASNFDLRGFELNMPIPLNGGASSILIRTNILNGNPALNTGFSSAPYFYTDQTIGAMTFFAPLNGATTTNSSFPRTELTELEEWQLSTFNKSTMTASLQVTQMPPVKRKIVIGQIHSLGLTDKFGHTVKASPMLKIIYDTNSTYHKQTCAGCIRAQVRPTPATGTNDQLDFILVSNVGLNTLFTYKVELSNNGTLRMSTANKQAVYQINTSSDNTKGWGAQRLYFKAGVYLQENGTSSTQGGKAQFTYFKAAHQ